MSGAAVKDGLRRAFGLSVAETKKAGPERRKRLPPVSIRFSPEERAALEKRANGQPLGPYIREQIFRKSGSPGKSRRKSPTKQQQAMARALRGLGRSGIAGALESLVLAVEEGRLPIEHAQEKDLRRALAKVSVMRDDLIAALGLHADGGPS